MSSDQVPRHVARSALSGYARILVRMGLGLVTFRLLYRGLTPEQFGFWSLLWAIFGYGILLDFGFGYAAQKRVAELSVRKDWDGLSRVLSTIFFFYLGGAAVIVVLGTAFSGTLIGAFDVPPPLREEFRHILVLFLVGIGLAFPLGIFPEVLQGQQRISTANNLTILSTVANFVCVAACIWFHWPFQVLVILALACVVGPYLLAARLALQAMPGVRLRPGLFSRRSVMETSRFSFYAYLNILSNVLRNKADPVVISSLLGVAQVTPYQAGGKVGEMFGLLTRQVADVLSPTAAHLHAKGDREALRRALLDGLRLSILTATPLYVVTLAYLDGVIRLLTGVKEPTREMLGVGVLLLTWYYSLVLTHWVFKRMFMMAGQERRMMLQGVSEAALNIGLSVGLTWWMRSILGVAWGSLIPTLLFGWGLLWGWSAREAQMSRWELFRTVVLPAWLGCLPMVLLALGLRLQPWWTSGGNLLLLALESGLVLAAGLAGLWRFSLTPAERERLGDRLRRRRRAAPTPP